MKTILYSLCLLLITSICISCDEDENTGSTNDNFDRSAMLTHWADNIIIPSYQNFKTETSALKVASDNFINSPSQANLDFLREEFKDAYLSWQNVELFNIGPAVDLFIRANMNIYPTNTQSIDNLIQLGDYNLLDPNLNNEQGFPALDYLLFGLEETDAEILQLYDNDFNGDKYTTYLTDVINRIDDLATNVLEGWTSGYRDNFVSNSGSSANSSVDVFVNVYLEYYEVYFRSGKIGIPAGAFTGISIPNNVEGLYAKNLSKELCLEALTTFQNFFNGGDPTSSFAGQSLKSYLDFLDTMKDGENLSTLINNQFEVSRSSINALDESFYNQVLTDNNAMLNAFEDLQANVIYLKSDMFSALSINLDFDSGDGD